MRLLCWLCYYLHEIHLKSLLLKNESVLVPDEVGHLGVPTVLLHAPLEQTKDIGVVRVVSELKFATVQHKFSELLWVTLGQLIHCNFKLLLLDVVVLLILRPTW